jgi:hypothetical protein
LLGAGGRNAAAVRALNRCRNRRLNKTVKNTKNERDRMIPPVEKHVCTAGREVKNIETGHP